MFTNLSNASKKKGNVNKNKKEGKKMAVSMGSVLMVKGETAEKLLLNLSTPNNQLLNKCSALAQSLKDQIKK